MIPEEEKNKKENTTPQKQEVSSAFKNLTNTILHFLYDILHIKDGTDVEGTADGIKRDIVFKGHSVWILIASIFIASIGLNVNSAAVVIGAMLISPLMGPIVGIGFSVGTNDWHTLKRSVKFFLISVIVSVATSTIYFLLTPLKDAHSELLARTSPTFLDVLIAIFGGVTGIVAGSRKEKTNVIPGVAIATALMPPLCTAGYGLATGHFDYFFGAFYLFFINAVFISLATFIIVRYLKFPLRNFVHPSKEKKAKRYMTIFIILVILPSAMIFWDLIIETRFNSRVENFINENFKYEKSNLYQNSAIYNDTLSYIDMYVMGKELTLTQISDMTDKLKEYGLIKGGTGLDVTDSTIIRVHQTTAANIDSIDAKINNMTAEMSQNLRVGIIEDIYEKNEKLLTSKNARIEFLENKLISISKDSLPLYNLKNEIEVQYPKIIKFAYANSIEPDTLGGFDTIPTFLINWNKKIYRSERKKQSKTLAKWLKVRLHLDTVRVVQY